MPCLLLHCVSQVQGQPVFKGRQAIAVVDEMEKKKVDYNIHAKRAWHDGGRRVTVRDASYNGDCSLKGDHID